ncbi:MAG: hypothetical protein MZV70_56275 [Desulfobacterales bacterium]|nr:hypothetical protein [Desulfobacterales bacterium]
MENVTAGYAGDPVLDVFADQGLDQRSLGGRGRRRAARRRSAHDRQRTPQRPGCSRPRPAPG